MLKLKILKYMLLASLTLSSTINATVVTGQIIGSTGLNASGSITLQLSKTCTGPGGVLRFRVPKTILLVNGVFTADIPPNDNCTPTNTVYEASYFLDGTSPYKEYWYVPNSIASLSLSSIRIALPLVPPFGTLSISLLTGCTTNGQVPTYNGTSFVCAIPSGGGSGVPTSRQVLSGTGLAGGGDLTADRTLSLSLNGGSNQTCGSGNKVSAISSLGIITCTPDSGSGGTITSLNGISSANQTFVNHSNIQMVSTGTTHTITWVGKATKAMLNDFVAYTDQDITIATTGNFDFRLGNIQPPKRTVASRGAASSHVDREILVTDCESNSSCSTGGGSIPLKMWSNGTNWLFTDRGSGAGGGTCGSSGQVQINSSGSCAGRSVGSGLIDDGTSLKVNTAVIADKAVTEVFPISPAPITASAGQIACSYVTVTPSSLGGAIGDDIRVVPQIDIGDGRFMLGRMITGADLRISICSIGSNYTMPGSTSVRAIRQP